MRGCSIGSDLIVNAGVDSMGGFVEGGVGIGTKSSPRKAAIEKVHAKLRQECDGLQERRRQLEFLEEGGDPLEFKFGDAASLSVQSTSLPDKHPDQFVTSEVKGSRAITASPQGDSAESSGRPGVPHLCEPNSADNLMLFDGENKFVGRDRGCRHPSRSNVTPSGQSSKFNESQNAKELGNATAFDIPRKAYKRRYRPRPDRDSARSSSSDIACGGHGTSLPSQHFPKELKEPVSDSDKDQNSLLNIARLPSSNSGTALKITPSDNQVHLEVDGVKPESNSGFKKDDMLDTVPDASDSRGLPDGQHDQNSLTGVQEMPLQEAPERPQLPLGKERVDSAGLDCQPHTTEREVDNQASSVQLNGFCSGNDNKPSFPNEVENSGAILGTKGLDSESSCTQTCLSLDGHNDGEMCTNLSILDSNGDLNRQLVVPVIGSDLNVKNEMKADVNSCLNNEEFNSGQSDHQSNGCLPKSPEERVNTVSNLQSEVKDKHILERMEEVGPSELETVRKCTVVKRDDSNSQNICNVGIQGTIDSCIAKRSECVSQRRVSNLAPEGQAPRIQVDEDSILKEAQVIEAKRKRIAELSAVACQSENCQKSQWDYVLEEMAWLANDFAQERLWKITAAGQISHQIAFSSRLRFQEQNRSWEQKQVAHNLAKVVIDFWHSIEGKNKKMELPGPKKDYPIAIEKYAMRFLKYNDSDVPKSQAEAPLTPDRISDGGIVDTSGEDHLTEENLFYSCPLGAMDAYRISIESHVQLCRRAGSSVQEEVETSACDAVADCAFEVDEGETSVYDRSVALEGSKSSRLPQKTRKIHLKAYSGRPYDVGADSLFTQCVENRVGPHQSMLLGKRPASNVNVSIPTKRVRTASRQRVLSPFGASTAGCVQFPTKTDASSGDSGSFQDDHSTLHGGSHINSLEVESVGDYEKHLLFDSAEVSKPKKKKKAKHLGSAYGHRWHVDSNYQTNLFQRDPSRKRLESHQLESNGSSGLFGQHNAKKPKVLRQSLENSFENNAPIGGSIPSPVASQSNMSNPNKLIRMLSGRDRSRKAKTLKMPAGQSGSGSPWSLFEDQALVVLVHDMGPNWELVSDAINSTLQFKCIYRKPNECKERHKILMDRTSGDGADSAEDSGSSQPYPSTLPGIPKGSARQLFQRLQGPMEEDTLKSHFEKIILIGKKYLLRMIQGGNHDLKQLQQPHDSHMLALSKLCSNNLNGGPILTPLDLCDAPLSSPDFLSAGFEGPHSSGVSISSQGGGPLDPASGANSGVQGSPNMILGNNFPSSSSPLNASVRYAGPRSASFPVDEHQRLQQFNQMLSVGNMQSNISAPGALAGSDSGGSRTHPSGNSMGTMSGLNRGIPMARPGFQGVASSSVLNSGSMLSSGMVAMPNTVNMHSGVSSNQGNPMLRPRDILHMIRPSQNQEAQRQMPELQKGNSQGVPPFGGLSSSFPNQTAPSTVSSRPLHHQQPHPISSQQPLVHSPHHPHLQGASHATNSQHQAYAIRLARERHLQQRLLQQQQQQLSHTQPHLPISSSLQNSPQITSQSSSTVSHSPLASPSSMSPMPQHQLKHPFPAHGLGRTAQTGGSSLTTQMGKQRPHQTGQQQLQNASRHHLPQRQQSESQKQAKVSKGIGRGKMMTHQNMQIDPSLLDGLPTEQVNQSAEKGEQTTKLLQSQGVYSGPGCSLVQPAKQMASQPQQPHSKIYSGQVPPSKKQQIPSIQPLASSNVLGPKSPHQSVPSSVVGSSNHRMLMHPKPQVQLQPKLVTHSQAALQGGLQRNRSLSSDPPKLQACEPQSEQHNVCDTSQVGKTPPQDCNSLTNATEVSVPGVAQMKAAVPSFDSIGTPPTNSAGSETVPEVIQGISQRQSSGNFSPIVPDASVQRKQESSELQPPSPVTQPQSNQQQLHQQPPLPQLDQALALQAGNRSLFAKHSESRPD